MLKQCENDLSRASIMKQAATIKTCLPMLLPGITVNTGPKDFYPLEPEPLRSSTASAG